MNKPIVVLRLVDRLAMGGVQQSVIAYLRHADRGRFRILCAAMQPAAAPPGWLDLPEAAACLTLDARHDRDRRAIRRLACLLVRERVDILHCHSYHANVFGRQAAILAGVPVVIAHYHSTYGHRRDDRFAAWERTLWPFTSRALMVSEAVRQARTEWTGLGAGRSAVVRVPIDIDRLRAARGHSLPALETFLSQGPAGRPLVATVGRLVPLKRVEDLIDAMALLQAEGRDAALAVGGDGPERPRLEARAAERGVARRIAFLGHLPEAAPLLAAAKAFALASDVEGFPQCNLEAMACGVPVISTPAGGAFEADPGARAIVQVPHRDPPGLARAIARLLDAPDEAARRAEAGARIAEQFDAGPWTRRIEALYEEEVAAGWLARNRPWGYGGPLAPARLALERARWRLWRRHFNRRR